MSSVSNANLTQIIDIEKLINNTLLFAPYNHLMKKSKYSRFFLAQKIILNSTVRNSFVYRVETSPEVRTIRRNTVSINWI